MKLMLGVAKKEKLAVIRLPPTSAIPSWILAPTSTVGFLSITRTSDELSLVCPERIVPDTFESDNANAMKIEKGWVSFKVQGPLDFSLTGILASLAQPLAAEGISIFAISTYDTDFILVKEDVMEKAAGVFLVEGHTVVDA
jgi:hypothetical protein